MLDYETYKWNLRSDLLQALALQRPEHLNLEKLQDVLSSLSAALQKKGDSPGVEVAERVSVELLDEVLTVGPLLPLIIDSDVTEIMINGPEKIFVERRGVRRLEPLRFESAQQLRYMIERLLEGSSGKRLDESRPYADLSMPDGSRWNIVIPPVVSGGPHITVRKYLRTIETLEDLIRMGTLAQPMASFLKACVKGRLNLLFSGATGSGKTTVLEVLSRYLSDQERIVVIEDTLELRLHQPNTVRMLTRSANLEGKGEITIGELFRNALHQRPSRILLGEIRGKEALDYLQAINSGHEGSMAVIHAATPEEAIVRLENLVSMSGLAIPVPVVRSQVIHGLQIIVQCTQLSDGSRKISRISQVVGFSAEGAVQTRDIFSYEPTARAPDGRISGRFVTCTDSMPFEERFRLAGALQEG